MTERNIHYCHGSQMWFIRETDLEHRRERDTKGGWYNCSDAEDAIDGGDLEFEEWQPVVHHGIWPEPTPANATETASQTKEG